VRPVNLIPPEDRRGDRAPLRAGKLSYVLVGVLALALAAITLVVVTGNQVKDREAELASLKQQETAAQAEAEALAPYAEFAALTESRVSTVTSLAQSRFDWERVMRELALVLPDDVWLTKLSASASADAASASDAGSAAPIEGPSLSMTGCGKGHESVARLLQALRDIDGVTRVGLSRSALPTSGTSSSSTGSSAGGVSGGDCQTRNFIAGFEVKVAFDGAPVAGSETAPAAPAAPATTAVTETTAPETEQAKQSVAEQTQKAENAANLIPGVAR
jgi:Tfp pilus assembly protein PilN